MLIKSRRIWDIPEHRVTPEHLFFDRRRFIAGAAALAASGAPALAGGVPRNPAFADAGRPVTPEALNRTFNNFYEFGASKRIAAAAEALPVRPWGITIDGLVANPMKLSVDDLLKKVTLEERIYRHRCVEAWAMVVPWTGFPLAKLVALADPKPEAKFLRMQTFFLPEIASGQQPGLFGGSYPWPYTEGLTLAEATNDLAFMVTGAYGKDLPKSMGAPIRLHLPWKYGFKSIKSVVSISFTDTRPVSFWETLAPHEYGFWANVNPEVPHPRWSQAQERIMGTDELVPTRLFNGYGEAVAGLYDGLSGEKLFT